MRSNCQPGVISHADNSGKNYLYKLIMKKFITSIAVLACSVQAQEIIKYEYTDADGKRDTVEAVVRTPKTDANKRAVVILHHAGGWGSGTTAQYADLLSSNGFVTIEPRLFNTRPKHTSEYVGQVFGALNYLSTLATVDPAQISVMGLSYGANLTVIAATEWSNKKFTDGAKRFKSYAAFYPVCWAHAATIKRTAPRSRASKFPDDVEDKWVGSPMKIFAGSDDDYEGRDPKSCTEFIEAIPDVKQRSVSSVNLYQGATHGWDQVSQSFMEPVACKGKGCVNNNVHNPEVTARAKEDLLKFLKD